MINSIGRIGWKLLIYQCGIYPPPCFIRKNSLHSFIWQEIFLSYRNFTESRKFQLVTSKETDLFLPRGRIARENFPVSHVDVSFPRVRFYNWESATSRSESDAKEERKRARPPRITLTRLNESTHIDGSGDRRSRIPSLPRCPDLCDHHLLSVLRRRKCCYPSSILGT